MINSSRHTVHAIRFLRLRKFLMVLPLLVLPFLTLLAWALGIVGEVKAENGKPTSRQGLNLNLPSAAPAKDSTWNKMRYYEQADKDSAKLRSYLKSDPYRKLELEVKEPALSLDSLAFAPGENKQRRISRVAYDPYPGHKKDDNEAKVYQKLEALNRELGRMDEQERREPQKRIARDPTSETISPDVTRLEAMMASMQASPLENKELTQVNQMLDKIMQIQNPEIGSNEDSLRGQSLKNKRKVFAIQTHQEDIISVLEPTDTYEDTTGKFLADSLRRQLPEALAVNRFYSLEDPGAETPTGQAITAVIQEDQALVSGGTVKFRIIEQIYIGGVRIPKGQFVYGAAILNGERLSITVSSIAYGNYLLPVSLTVYDADGIAGVHVPGAITRDVAKRSAAQSVQGLGTIGTLDPSFGAQMATAGLQAAQNLLSKSAKLVRVHLRAGYRVLLKDDNHKGE